MVLPSKSSAGGAQRGGGGKDSIYHPCRTPRSAPFNPLLHPSMPKGGFMAGGNVGDRDIEGQGMDMGQGMVLGHGQGTRGDGGGYTYGGGDS